MKRQDREFTMMPIRYATLLAAAAFLAGLVACSTAAQNRTDQVIETSSNGDTGSAVTSAAREVEAPYFVEVEFQKGSTQLTEQSRSAITSLLNRARAEGHVKDVKVLSWADQEYPTSGQKKLAGAQRRLADSRNRSIRGYVDSLNYNVDVDIHNMAERPSAVARWFNTSDARFKRAMVAAGLPTTADAAPATGRASHAVVLVTLKE